MQLPKERPTLGTPVMVDHIPGMVRMELVVLTGAIGVKMLAPPLPTAYRFRLLPQACKNSAASVSGVAPNEFAVNVF